MWHAPCNVTHVSCFMSINAIDFVAQPHLHSNKVTAEIVTTVVVRVCACVCVRMYVCVLFVELVSHANCCDCCLEVSGEGFPAAVNICRFPQIENCPARIWRVLFGFFWLLWLFCRLIYAP